MSDSAIDLLRPYINSETLIIADEHWSLSDFADSARIISNRFINTSDTRFEFNDFHATPFDQEINRVVIRIGKEKATNFRQINLAIEILKEGGQICICGGNKEGIKSTIKTLRQTLDLTQQSLNDGYRLALFEVPPNAPANFDDRNYQDLTLIEKETLSFLSKPGIFGWNKIDRGSDLLTTYFGDHLSGKVLDLGCGWGFLSIEASNFDIDHITATDNNAAALIACEANLNKKATQEFLVIPSDAGKTIKNKFDTIICNPPFHKGFEHDVSMSETFMEQTHRLMHPTGKALWVVNQFVGAHTLAKSRFRSITLLERSNGFDVWLFSKPF